MSRLGALSIGCFYACPEQVVRSIAALVKLDPKGDYAIVDPCAGEGDAVLSFCEHTLGAAKAQAVNLYAAESEAKRSHKLVLNTRLALPHNGDKVIRGNAFRVDWGETKATHKSGGQILWLNPPYAEDPVYVRMEERFLLRFAPTLCPAGLLIFILPVSALRASAATLSRHFVSLVAFRFPAEEYAAYGQVVVFGYKRPTTLIRDDPAGIATVNRWAAAPLMIPELPLSLPRPLFHVASHGMRAGFPRWDLFPCDDEALLAELEPWQVTDGNERIPVPGIAPEDDLATLLTQTFPLASPPRAAHISAGIAAGVFNGTVVPPDDPSTGLPTIAAKGVFDREWLLVDQKLDKDDRVIGEVQVQQPRLVVTVLDIERGAYHTIKSATEITGATSLAEMTTADLLERYGRGLMATMLERCPVLHDPKKPEHTIPLPAMKRRPFEAQAQVTMGIVKLLGGLDARPQDRRGRAAWLMGEIGVGKSTCALLAMLALRVGKAGIMCPPHLLPGWREQIEACLPHAQITVLSDIHAVDAFARSSAELPAPGEDTALAPRDGLGRGLSIALLSREAAKLGHEWIGVERCSKCGSTAAGDPDEIARRRARCTHQARTPTGAIAAFCVEFARALLPCTTSPVVAQMQPSPVWLAAISRAHAKTEEQRAAAWERVFASPRMAWLIRGLVEVMVGAASPEAMAPAAALSLALMSLVSVLHEPRLVEVAARGIYDAAEVSPNSWSEPIQMRATAQGLLLLLDAGPQARLAAELQHRDAAHFARSSHASGWRDMWAKWKRKADDIRTGQPTDEKIGYAWREWGSHEGRAVFLHGRAKAGKTPAAQALIVVLDALDFVHTQAVFTEGPVCGEPLFQAVPEPRRVPLANYIAKRHPKMLDFLVLDEGHELSSVTSAQGLAAHQLTNLGMPVLLLTGTAMNGYAKSHFGNQWALDPRFRLEFDRKDVAPFTRRYGFIKQLVQYKDQKGKVVEFGTMSDRVTREEKKTGDAPGVLPLFLLKYLLRNALTLHMSDLEHELPPSHEIVEQIDPGPELGPRILQVEKAMADRIAADLRIPGLAGKLWGAMSLVPSYPDRATADTSDEPDGAFVLRYPKSVGGEDVVRMAPFSSSTILPKERWMLQTIEREWSEDRNVLIFGWHEGVLPRLARLVQTELGRKCPVLLADKVPTGKRIPWIQQHVVEANAPALFVNPVSVMTGINNLVHDCTTIWMQDPMCNPITYRQANGRVYRIGQTKETRMYFGVYKGTLQVPLHKLLMHKVAVSRSTDGLDAEAALRAAGVGSQAFDALSVAKQLYNIIAKRQAA